MKAIVVTDQAAGTAGVKLVEGPEPQAAINDVVVQIHASAFTGDELSWPRSGSTASAVTGRLRSPATSWPEWSPPSTPARGNMRGDSLPKVLTFTRIDLRQSHARRQHG
jgi:hypothetical protein